MPKSYLFSYDRYLPIVTSILTAAYFASLNLFPNSYTMPLFILVLVSLPLLWKTKRHLLNPIAKPVVISLCLYFLLYFIFFLIHSEQTSTIDIPSRALLACFVLALLIQYPPKLKWSLYAIPVGAIVTGIIATYHTAILHHQRAFLNMGYMVIQTGGMSSWLTILSLICALYAYGKKNKSLLIISIIGSELGLYATILSGARGALLPLPFIIVIICWLYRQICTKKVIASIIMGIVLAAAAAYPQLKVRVDTTVHALEQYKEGNSVSSSGERLQMWKSALITASRYPVLGYGHKNINEEKSRQINEGLIIPNTLRYNRAHNQFLEELQTKGITGLILMLLVYLIPLKVFYQAYKKALQNSNQALTAVTIMGISHIMIIGGFSMTQHYLNHHSGTLLFVFGTAFFAAFTIHLTNRQDQSE